MTKVKVIPVARKESDVDEIDLSKIPSISSLLKDEGESGKWGNTKGDDGNKEEESINVLHRDAENDKSIRSMSSRNVLLRNGLIKKSMRKRSMSSNSAAELLNGIYLLI